ncbi:MAG TPA: acetylxylan esterase, partial [Vicinamibacteria bacterium]|nr:acetylxylan esterase [Vicinamibacteria bacterium]
LACGALAQERTGTVRLQVVPDHPDWTYAPGAPVTFQVRAIRDGHPFPIPALTYKWGPEMLPPSEEKTLALPPEGLTLKVAGLKHPGFLRLVATATLEGQEYRALATAGFAPEKIAPTVPNPPDFDAFWSAGKDALAKLPIDAKLVPMPESSTGKADCWHVSLQNIGADGTGWSRFFGVLCEPKGDGPFPALLQVPGAGVRAYKGNVEMAEKGIITLQIGIHGLPVNLDPVVYEALGRAALSGYPTFNLDERDRYYYRRVYLGCVRANDFLVSRPRYDGKTLGVTGGSQGGALSIVTAGLDPRVKVLAPYYPALSDVTGYLNDRAGGWPHMFKDEGRRLAPRIAVAPYYDVVNFARRVKAPGLYSWGYNDEVCPPTSMYAAYGVITAEKSLLLALETGHFTTPEQVAKVNRWLEDRLLGERPAP